jgi:hypothetical protein
MSVSFLESRNITIPSHVRRDLSSHSETGLSGDRPDLLF